jgi:hypothetical protein
MIGNSAAPAINNPPPNARFSSAYSRQGSLAVQQIRGVGLDRASRRRRGAWCLAGELDAWDKFQHWERCAEQSGRPGTAEQLIEHDINQGGHDRGH